MKVGDLVRPNIFMSPKSDIGVVIDEVFDKSIMSYCLVVLWSSGQTTNELNVSLELY